MKYMLIILLFCSFTFINCEKKEKPTSIKEQTVGFIDNLLPGIDDPEKTDSARIDRFLKVNTKFTPYRSKIHKFYKRRNYELAWSDKGDFLPHASMFLNLLKNSESLEIVKGFSTASSLKDSLELAEKGRESKDSNVKLRHNLDLHLTSLYFNYSQLTWRGKVEPKQEGIPWYITRKKIPYGKTLDSILASEGENPFAQYMPVHQEYNRLSLAYAELKAIEKNGGWPKITLPDGKSIKENDTLSEVKILRKRLHLSKDLKDLTEDTIFTPDLSEAVRSFQRRHGLKEDGICGGKTLEELNIPVGDRVKQILVNMERWRWVPQKIGKNYIVINIPEFQLRVIENDKPAWNMKVIVGAEMTNTPIFNDKLEYIVVNPSWNVPSSIVLNEFLPMIRKNPSILSQQNFEVYKGKETNVIDPHTIAWDSINEKNFPYSFRQLPGAGNALGKIKFLFPNNFNVYLHDTPHNYLFDREKRDFSHGCIRLHEPFKLAEYLLKNNKQWAGEKIKTIKEGKSTWIKLDKEAQLPVYILYFTVWVDENGQLNFRDDIYGHDKKLSKLLFE